MRIVRFTWLAGLFLLGAAPLVAQSSAARQGREPTFQDRTLTEWIGDLSGLAPYTRVSAAYAVGSMGAAAKTAVPALTANLKAEQATVRYASALALGEIGPDAASAVPDLRALLDDRNDDVAAIARKAIRAITGEAVE